MAEYNEQELMAGLISLRRRRKLQRVIKAGGVVSLGSLWAITKPEILADIKGDKALVKSRKLSDGSCSLYIEIPLLNDKYEELDLCGMTDFEEGDEVSISSIIAIFTEDVKGKPIVRYEAFLVDENVPVRIEDVKRSIFNESVGLLLGSKTKGPTVNISYEGGKCPEGHYKCFICTNCVFINIFDSESWRIIRLDGYKNARPLTHGLILAEVSECLYDVLNAEGLVLIKNTKRVDYGPDYLNCNDCLWIYNSDSHLLEEKSFGENRIVTGTIGDGLIGVYRIKDLCGRERGTQKNEKKYYFADLNGNIKMEVEDGWSIVSGFHNGKAVIKNVNSNNNDISVTFCTIDKNGNVIHEESTHTPLDYHDVDLDRDNWDAMTDGMCGDYPEEGFDGDYESIGF